MTDLFTRLVRCLFEKSQPTAEQDTHKGEGIDPKGILTKKQLDAVVGLGKVAFLKIFDGSENDVAFTRADFTYESGNGQIIDIGMKVGLIRGDEEAEMKPETSEVCSSRKGRRFVCCTSKDVGEAEMGMEEVELIPRRPKDGEIKFALQEYCAGMYMAHTTENNTWMKTIKEVDILKNVDKLANVFAFASGGSSVACSSLVSHLVNEITSEGQVQNFAQMLQLQKMIELCLQLNFEGKCEGSLNEELGTLFSHNMVRLIGISKHKLRLLSYLLRYAEQASTGCRLNLTSVELFRFENHNWDELQEYLYDFAAGSCKGIACKNLGNLREVPKQACLEEKIESNGFQNESLFLNYQSGRTGAVSTLESVALHDLIESQCGDCLMSTSTEMLVSSLSNLKMIDSITLIGSILSSGEICSLVKVLLQNLKKLDLRLNQEIDDVAFSTVACALKHFKSLTDLRLSLFKVTDEGFSEVRQLMEKEKGSAWERLTTLYLLHCDPSDSFVKFLQNYLKQLNVLYISGRTGVDDRVSESVHEDFEKSV